MADLRWNDVRASFSDTNQGISNAIQGYSNAGTVFGQLRKSILDEEQRAWDNAFKEKEFQEKTRQFNEGHKLNIFKEMETQRHNVAGEEHDKNVLEQTKVRDNQNYTIGLQNAQANLMQASAAKQNANSMAEWRRADIAQKQALNDLKIEEEKLNLTVKKQAVDDDIAIRTANKETADAAYKKADEYAEENKTLTNEYNFLRDTVASTGIDTVNGAQVKVSGFDPNTNLPILIDPATGKQVIGDTQRRMMDIANKIKQNNTARNESISQTGMDNVVNTRVTRERGINAGSRSAFAEGAALEKERLNRNTQNALKLGEAEMKRISEGMQKITKGNFDKESRAAISNAVLTLAQSTGTDTGIVTDALLANTGTGTNKEIPLLAKIIGSDGTKSIDVDRVNTINRILQANMSNPTKQIEALSNSGYEDAALILHQLNMYKVQQLRQATLGSQIVPVKSSSK